MNTPGQNKATHTSMAKAKQTEPVGIDESAQERVARIYRSRGGPLIGWLLDEANLRDMQLNTLSAELGVTVGYINQMRSGLRNTENIGQEFVQAAAHFLGVPPIVVKLLAGQIRMSDFALQQESEEELIERAFRHVQCDLQVRIASAVNLTDLPLQAKQALVMLHSEATGCDYFHAQQLPQIVHTLSKAMLVHGEASLKAYEDKEHDQQAKL